MIESRYHVLSTKSSVISTMAPQVKASCERVLMPRSRPVSTEPVATIVTSAMMMYRDFSKLSPSPLSHESVHDSISDSAPKQLFAP